MGSYNPDLQCPLCGEWFSPIVSGVVPEHDCFCISCDTVEQDVRKYNDLLKNGCKAQIHKLKQNTHKGSFDISVRNGVLLGCDEMGELIEAFSLWKKNPTKQGLQDIIDESADVANCAHIVINAALKELEKYDK